MESFDLNLARVFVYLYETGSVTATAETLQVTQPTVSYSLGKLRRHFDDDLFRRSRRGMEPTVVATRIYEPMHRALGELEEVVRPAHSFDPATMSARLTVAMTDLGETTLLPRLIAEARATAPRVSFTIQPLNVDTVERELVRGEIDAFIATPVLTSHRTVRIPLFGERYVGLVAADHPRIRDERISMDNLLDEPQASVFGPGSDTGPRAALAAHGLLNKVVMEGTRFGALPYLLAATDLFAIVPSQVAQVFAASHDLRVVMLPFKTEPIEVAAYVRHEASQTPPQRWLTSFIVDVLGGLDEPGRDTTG